MTGPATFRFLGENGSLDEYGWDDPDRAKLWRYNLHYFDDLNAKEARARRDWPRALIDRWVAALPPTAGSGWEPYPTSLRIVNWVKFALAGNELSDAWCDSLSVQARWLRKRLEWHLLGNHLFANAKALVFAGLFFDGREADEWLTTGIGILRDELPEQILSDGAQFELSPMYHALALEDFLDLVNIARFFGRYDLARELASRIPAMVEWLLKMCHPDGDLAFFNDAATKIAPDNAELLRYTEDLGFVIEPPADGITHYEQSGYVRIVLGPAVVIADLARIGPDYLPGHAHADSLSFELSLDGERFVVNSGISEYGTGAERQRQRGTAAHSTLVVDSENSSEVWSGFRVGRRAKPFDVKLWEEANSFIAKGAHDGYKHLPGRPVHRREWRLSKDRLSITDTVEGLGDHQLEVYFHLAPSIDAVVDKKTGVVKLEGIDGRSEARFSSKGGVVEIIGSSWHPEFGVSIATKAIYVCTQTSLPHTLQSELVWELR